MSSWLNRVVIAGARNGTTSHTQNPSTGTVVDGTAFTPTAGRFLVAINYGAVTFTTPTGWTLPTGGSAVNNGGLYVFTKTAAGSDSITTTQNASNYAIVTEFLEFPAGSSLLSAVAATNGTAPSITGLTGTYTAITIFGLAIGSAATGATTSFTGPTALTAQFVVKSGTDGYGLYDAYQDTQTSATYTWAYAVTGVGGTIPVAETIAVAIRVAAGGSPQTTTAQTGTITLTALAGASTAGAVTKTAQPATITLAGIQGTSTTGQAITAQVATISLAAVVGTSTTGATTKIAQTATLALSGIQGASSTGAVSTIAQVAQISLTAVQGMSRVAGATVAQPAVLILSGVQGVSTTGSATTTAQVASISLTAVQGVSRVAGATVAQPAVLVLTAVPGVSTKGSTTTTAQVAAISLTAVHGPATVGPASTVAQPAALVLTAAQGVSTTGPTTSTAQVASISLTALGGTSIRGPVSTVAQVGGLTLVAIAGTALAGGVTNLAQVATIALTAIPGGGTQAGTPPVICGKLCVTLDDLPRMIELLDPFRSIEQTTTARTISYADCC